MQFPIKTIFLCKKKAKPFIVMGLGRLLQVSAAFRIQKMDKTSEF